MARPIRRYNPPRTYCKHCHRNSTKECPAGVHPCVMGYSSVQSPHWSVPTETGTIYLSQPSAPCRFAGCTLVGWDGPVGPDGSGSVRSLRRIRRGGCSVEHAATADRFPPGDHPSSAQVSEVRSDGGGVSDGPQRLLF